MNSNLQQIQENMYNLYKLKPQELNPLLGQTYHRKESGGDWSNEEYACVIKVTEEDSWRLYNRQYNELSLNYSTDQKGFVDADRCLSLSVSTVDDGSWTAYIPYTGQDLFLLWASVINQIRPVVTLDFVPCNDWYSFTHNYFLRITKELGATDYDYD